MSSSDHYRTPQEYADAVERLDDDLSPEEHRALLERTNDYAHDNRSAGVGYNMSVPPPRQQRGTQPNGTQANRTQTNGAQTNGTQANGTQMNGTQSNGAQGQRS